MSTKLSSGAQQLLVEKIDLDEKSRKLFAEIIARHESALRFEDSELLLEQHDAMLKYSSILTKRIARTVRSDLPAAALSPLPVIDPGPDSHASAVLSPAIKRAMDDLDLDPLSCSVNVNRAYNDLFDAFWSETPAPASEVAKRRYVVRPRT